MEVKFNDDYNDPNPPTLVFESHFERSPVGFGGYTAIYDVTSDGHYFMILNANPITPRIINVIRNWPRLLGIAGD